MLLFSGRRIKTPERGLLSMHPFVDALEGRSLFTGTAHDGAVNVQAVIDAPAGTAGRSTWSVEPIAPPTVVNGEPAVTTATALAVRSSPGQIELTPAGVPPSAFNAGGTIGDTAETLFGNVIWDRRGRNDPVPLPTDEQIAAARESSIGPAATTFAAGRSFTGAMNPFLVMKAPQAERLFAA